MIIEKIQLRNITTHKDTTISFQNGLNVLAGANGTGKSTVLKMIGHNLFDFLPAKSQNVYVRDAPDAGKSGLVKIWVRGVDDHPFLIERSVARKPNTIKVTDLLTSTIIDKIHNKANLQKWLKIQTGINQEHDLSKLFQNAIGVEQGTFTEPFLRRPSDRKDFFNPLLNVEIYNKIYKKSASIVKEFNEEINEYKLEIKGYKTQLERKVVLEKSLNRLQAEILDNTTKKKILSQEFTKIQSKYQKSKQIKEQIEKLQRNISELTQEQTNIAQQSSIITSQRQESEKAKEICQQNLSPAQEFIKIKKIEEELITKKEKFDRLMKTQHTLEKNLTTIQTKIEAFQKQKEEIENLKESYQNLKKDYETYQKNSLRLEQIQQLSTQTRMKRDIYEKQSKNILTTQKSIDDIKQKIVKIPELRTLVDQMEKVQEELTKIEKQISVLLTQKKEYEKNKESSKDGKCPFLGSKCQNIEGESLTTYFEKLLATNFQALQKSNQHRKTLISQFQKCKEAQQSLDRLKLLEAQVQQKLELVNQLKLENVAIKVFLDENRNVKTELDSLQKKQISLKSKAEQYQIVHSKITTDLPILNKKISVMRENRKPIEAKIAPILKYLQENNSISEKLGQVRTTLKKLLPSYEKYQTNLQQSRKLPAILEQLDNLKQKSIVNQKKLKQIQVTHQNLNKQFDLHDFDKLEQKKEKLNNELTMIKQDILNKTQQQHELEREFQDLLKIENKLSDIIKDFENLENALAFTQTIRDWFREAGPKITGALLNNINRLASELFRDLMGLDGVKLIWQEDFDVLVISSQNERVFSQLSGGEQMAVALAIRLAILRILTSIDFAFFDEPTTNLDTIKRQNLAKCIQNVRGFRQLFVISHDDTFEENADHVIRFEKDESETTKVDFLKV
ncbi:DNA double-strand break repair Rad50 ATPase [Candidatus Lokiarchaeum ossiferum]|uniref:DNA double-strand break repair Rad50 ATPase n=1 Tax=Candidatus Lokiarchaeum ossiferum TaxID=2951803 RepID=A0ABY6HML9_9ARCH|nr:DNA double-strand break repair Rad50 ATPase [Candidatus Lokiarchaeum sp. B-35]